MALQQALRELNKGASPFRRCQRCKAWRVPFNIRIADVSLRHACATCLLSVVMDHIDYLSMIPRLFGRHYWHSLQVTSRTVWHKRYWRTPVKELTIAIPGATTRLAFCHTVLLRISEHPAVRCLIKCILDGLLVPPPVQLIVHGYLDWISAD